MSLFESLLVQEYFQPPVLRSTSILRVIFVAIRNDRPVGLSEDQLWGEGTEVNPYDGTTQPRLDAILFNFALRAGTCIRIGPGVFQTKGGAGNAHAPGEWAIGSNVRITGAGMFQTTLQLIGVEQRTASGIPITTSTPIIAALTSTTVDNIEISDLTLDCNGHRQGVFQGGRIVQPKVMVEGVSLSGSNHTIRRVRVINWGTFVSQPKGGLECFPIATGGGAVDPNNPRNFQNSVIEDCVVEQPCRSQGRETTCIVLAGGLTDYRSRKLVYFKNGRLRNNYVNGELVNPMYPVHTVTTASYNSGTDRTTLRTFYPHCMRDGDWVVFTTTPMGPVFRKQLLEVPPEAWTLSVPGDVSTATSAQILSLPSMRIDSVSLGSGMATFNTLAEHGRIAGDWVRISPENLSLLTVPNTISTPNPAWDYLGSFMVLSVPNPTSFTVASSATSVPSPVPVLWLDRYTPNPIAIKKGDPVQGPFLDMDLGVMEFAWNAMWVEYTTHSPHFLVPGDHVLLTGIQENDYNGYWRVDQVISPSRFVVMMDAASNKEIIGLNTAGFGQNFQGLQIFGCEDGVAEGNRLLNIFHGGPYHDTWNSMEMIGRNNYYFNVFKGVVDGLGGTDDFLPAIVFAIDNTPLSDPTHLRAITANKSYLVVGDIIHILGGDVQYNGYFEVVAVDDTSTPKTFDFDFGGVPLSFPPSPPSTVFNAYRAFSSWTDVFEDNIIDLSLRSVGMGASPPYGVSIAPLGIFDRTNPFHYSPKLPFFKKVTIRGNIIRFSNNWVNGQNGNAAGVVVQQARELNIERNLVTLGPVLDATLPIGCAWIAHASAFNNRNMAGTLLEVVNNGDKWNTIDETTRKVPELETDLDFGLYSGL